MYTVVDIDASPGFAEHCLSSEVMGWLLIISIAAMTSFMTMVQLIALTLLTPSQVPQASVVPQTAKSVSVKSTKKTAKADPKRSGSRHTSRTHSHGSPISAHQYGIS